MSWPKKYLQSYCSQAFWKYNKEEAFKGIHGLLLQ